MKNFRDHIENYSQQTYKRQMFENDSSIKAPM